MGINLIGGFKDTKQSISNLYDKCCFSGVWDYMLSLIFGTRGEAWWWGIGKKISVSLIDEGYTYLKIGV